MNSITRMDLLILDFIQTYLTSPTLDKIMVTITSLGNAGIIWILFSLVFLTTKEYKKMARVLIAAMVLNFVIVNVIIKPIAHRIRPFELEKIAKLLIEKPLDFSFPSGHTAVSFCFLTVVLAMSKSRSLKILVVILAILISYSRLYLYVHYPSDVFFGGLIGFLVGLLTVRIYKKRL